MTGYYFQLFTEAFVPLLPFSHGTSPCLGGSGMSHSLPQGTGDRGQSGIQKSMLGFGSSKAWSSWGHQRTQCPGRQIEKDA